MERIKKYNEVLGLTKSVNAEELKQLYRLKAKELHPDINQDSASHDQFVLLSEAYEFYSALLTKIGGNERAQIFNSKKYPEHYYTEKWNVERRMAARKRAAKQAKMKFEEYERRGYNKHAEMFFLIFDVLNFLLALVVLIALPVFMFWVDQFRGLIIALLVQFVTYGLWSKAIKRFIPSSNEDFINE